MTNEERSTMSLLLRDFESRFNSRIECLPKYYDKTKSIDNRLKAIEERQDVNLKRVINIFFGIVVVNTMTILYLLVR